MNSIYVLGAGTPTPTAERFGSSYVLNIEDEDGVFEKSELFIP